MTIVSTDKEEKEMRYSGGKGKLAKHLALIILNIAKGRPIIEPFCGSLGMTVAIKPQEISDASKPLITLIESVRNGWIPPEDFSEEDYKSAKTSKEEVIKAYAGICCSWGGKWFGGYVRTYEGPDRIKTARSLLLKRVEATRHIPIKCCSYDELIIHPGYVLYCDPPYSGTLSAYPTGKFNHEKFWLWVRETSNKGADVIISEYYAPEGIEMLLEHKRKTNIGSNREGKTEKLFLVRARDH